MSDEAAEPATEVSDEIHSFWAMASRQARLDNLPGYFGPTPLASVEPPAWSFGATPEQSTELADLVASGVKTATASAAEDYTAEGEALPEPGVLGIVLDGDGHPRALVATTDVQVVPFDEVADDHAFAEGEGDRTLASWREGHERFFRDHDPHGRGFRPDMPVVLERFEVLYPLPVGPDQPV